MKVYEPLYFWLHPAAHAPTWGILAFLALFCLSALACAVIDARSMIIPNRITYPLILISIGTAPLLWEDWKTHLLAGAIVGVLFVSISFVKIRGQYAMGMGDVKLYTAAGFALGAGVMPCIILASLAGSIVGLIMLRGRLGVHMPHGPHIAFGVVASSVLGLIGWLG